MSTSSDFSTSINSPAYQSWQYLQLEPDAILRGNGKRYKPMISEIKKSEQQIKADPNWREKEREYQEMKRRNYDD